MGRLLAQGVVAASALVLAGAAYAAPEHGAAAPSSVSTAPRPARCAAGDRPETALQGQVPLALRDGKFAGFNCNLTLVSNLPVEGAGASSGMITDKAGVRCFYMASPNNRDMKGNPIDRKYPGVAVIDISDSANPKLISTLTTMPMINPWESLRANLRRKLLAAVYGDGSMSYGPHFTIYDVGTDCRRPRLLADVNLGTVQQISGHEGAFAPDGMTYYVGDPRNNRYHAVDISDPTKPRLIATVETKSLPLGGGPHGMSVSADGNRFYPVAAGLYQKPLGPDDKAMDGFYVLDVSEVQARKPNPQMKFIAAAPIRDGSVAQVTIPMLIGGKRYMLHNGEGGAAFGDPKASCAAGVFPFPLARIFDMSDEKRPKLAANIVTEVNNPANCDKVLPDLGDVAGRFVYGTHYCSVDNRDNTTAVACGSINSGIRVFDVRNPLRPAEIAYFNPPNPPGAFRDPVMGALRSSTTDSCMTRVDFDFERRELISACSRSGMLVLKFAPGVWPMPESTRATDQNH